MTDPGSSTHDLDVAGHGPPDIAGAIFVCHRALADIGDDFHVGMGVTAKAGAGSDLVVVPDHEGAEGAIRGIAVGRNDEVMARLQPAASASWQDLAGSSVIPAPWHAAAIKMSKLPLARRGSTGTLLVSPFSAVSCQVPPLCSSWCKTGKLARSDGDIGTPAFASRSGLATRMRRLMPICFTFRSASVSRRSRTRIATSTPS